MDKNIKIKKISILVGLFIIMFGISFGIYRSKNVEADSADNKVRVNDVTMTYIKTGENSRYGNFGPDGLDYNSKNAPAYSAETGYIPGSDANDKNRIVRTFDKLKYGFDLSIVPKNGIDDADDRSVKITVDLGDAKDFVACDSKSPVGKQTCEYTFGNIDTEEEVSEEVTLYVLNATNGAKIDPKFNIKESTDKDNGINLGKIDDTTHYYSYKDNNYETTPSTEGFVNYMPTIVSATPTSTINVVLSKENKDSQFTTYTDGDTTYSGRYFTAVAKINTQTMKGYSLPDGEIDLKIVAQSYGNTKPIVKPEWIRLYTPNKIGTVEPVVSPDAPYSVQGQFSNSIPYPGKVEVTQSDSTYDIKLTDYKYTFSSPTLSANNLSLVNEYNISSIAITMFSPRTREDGRKTFSSSFTAGSWAYKNLGSNAPTSRVIPGNMISFNNEYYEVSDFSSESAFYDLTDNKVSKERTINGMKMVNGTGGVSKGTTLKFKTKFKYNKTLSNQGLREVIKIDDKAFRFIPYNDKDYNIKVTCGGNKCKNINENDFTVKFLSGSFDNKNYSVNDINSLKFSNDDDKNIALSRCPSNLSVLTVNQIQNLYGGPCIKANEGVEQEFDKIVSAKDENGKEIHLTKAIVETKEGVKLPDNFEMEVELYTRVRNVSDLTQTYQGSVLTSSSQYDDELYYYSPRITEDEESVTNPDNYIKSVYRGREIIKGDTSVFGDSLKIVNFTSREEITVTNKNKDGTIKTNYDVSKNETINYNVKTIIEDNNEKVGADDVWYINSLQVVIRIPKELEYLPNKDYLVPTSVTKDASSATVLTYTLPYTKPNMKIKDINFDTKLMPNIPADQGAVPVTVESSVYAKNINGEIDTSVIGSLSSSYTIYATGMDSVIVQQAIGKSGTVVEKNDKINYILKAYNNTSRDINDYSFIDILPYNGDSNGTKFNGTYSIKIDDLPDSFSTAKIYCTKKKSNTIVRETTNKDNEFKICDLSTDFVDGVTAIEIRDISIKSHSYMDEIHLTIKPKNNNYENSYSNNFMGETSRETKINSNTITAKVVSRRISGKVFLDLTGNGVKDGTEKYLSNIPVTLYAINADNSLKEVKETVTDKNGAYEFKNLDKGRYKIKLLYDPEKYDLTLRYATEDRAKDSDAYKLNDNGEAEISSKYEPYKDESDVIASNVYGIRVNKAITNVEDMDMGLLSRQSLSFTMKKYITKLDVRNNNVFTSNNYNNQSFVHWTVLNPNNTYIKAYYGIAITNNSYKSGYVKLVEEDLPNNMQFDPSDPYNKQWVYANGVAQSTALENDLINPGETRYLQIALYDPNIVYGQTYLNTASVLETEIYEPDKLADDDTKSDHDDYKVGDQLNFAGMSWHVIDAKKNVTREMAIKDLGLDQKPVEKTDESTDENGTTTDNTNNNTGTNNTSTTTNETTSADGTTVNARVYTAEEEEEINAYIRRNQILTLLADSGSLSNKLSHMSDTTSTYKWSQSNINNYLNKTVSTYSNSESSNSYKSNNEWMDSNSINLATLFDQSICDDSSSLQVATYGGELAGNGWGKCQSQLFTTSKVRLLTLSEFNKLVGSGLSDLSWLYGKSNYWLENTTFVTPNYLEEYKNYYNNNNALADGSKKYGQVDYHNRQNAVQNKAMYIDASTRTAKDISSNTQLEVRPVIQISTHNIVLE